MPRFYTSIFSRFYNLKRKAIKGGIGFVGCGLGANN